MSTPTTRPRTRVANHQIDELLRELVPFTNYNASIVATKGDTFYSVTHWSTEIVRIDLVDGERQNYNSVYHFDPRYYSQTTSTLQGRILRNLLSPREVYSLVDWYWNNDNKPLARRLRRLAGAR